MKDREVLYRCFANDGELLYIGRTLFPMERLYAHAYSARWFKYTARIDLEWAPDGISAAKAEAAAIKKELPKYNKLFKRRGKPFVKLVSDDTLFDTPAEKEAARLAAERSPWRLR